MNIVFYSILNPRIFEVLDQHLNKPAALTLQHEVVATAEAGIHQVHSLVF